MLKSADNQKPSPWGEARNPPLPVADEGGCSANEATSFVSVSAAKRLCRIVRAVAAAAALSLYSFANGCCAAYTSPPPAAEPLLKEKPFGECTHQLSLSPPRLIPAPNHCPRGTLIADQRGRAQHDQEEKQEANGGKLAFIRTVQAFTCYGGRAAGGQGHSLFSSNRLLRHTQVLCYFLH